MFEAPQRVTDLIVEWVEAHMPPVAQTEAGAS
ncbi:hypothetical protein MHPYR_120041 [uncultured Mycobacterium sp.]|uniref:Uncharacterized protein n=1 Tax=uncultured Mycobacterium sp. TaxID=171292 RepID=A0A1Y5NZ84_9MYCO|nr:hypothetical protein MHPYR_120041 [uncultured Mycobacterium sp.]